MIWRSARILAALAALAFITTGSATAQQRSAECRGLRTGNFRLNSTKLYLDQAVRFSRTDPSRYQRALSDAERQLSGAAGSGGDPMTIAFFYGELYLFRGDLVGADSMFTRAEQTAEEECTREITRMRRNEWAPLVNLAQNQIQAGNNDSALVLLRRAQTIFRNSPVGFLRMAGVFASRDQTDSAVAYFRLAGRAGTEPREQELRVAAFFGAARLLQGLDRFAEAEETYREFLRLAPRDLAGMAGLGAVLTGQNKTAEANAVFDTLQAAADTVTSYDVLFNTATELFRATRYPLAARLLERGLSANRCERDGLYNLVNTYLAMRDSTRLLQSAQRLIAVDSMNRMSLERLAAAWQLAGNSQRTLATLLRRDSLPWTFEVMRFEPADSTAAITAVVNNPQARALPAFALTIEFVNGACEVVASTAVQVPEVAAGGSHRVSAAGRGRGIVAYRYRAN